MNDALVERLSQHVENAPDYCLSGEGIEIFETEIFNKYPYSEFLPWIQSLPDSPVKQAMLNRAQVYACLLREYLASSTKDAKKPTLEQSLDDSSAAHGCDESGT